MQIVGYSPPVLITNNNTAPPPPASSAQVTTSQQVANDVIKMVDEDEDTMMEDGDIVEMSPEMYDFLTTGHKPNHAGNETVIVHNGNLDGVVKNASSTPAHTSTSTSSSVDYHAVMDKEGHTVQCIPLPAEVTADQYVVSITPNHHSSHVIVVTAPKTLHRRISVLCDIPAHCHRAENAGSSGAQDATDKTSSTAENKSGGNCSTGSGGCILIYKANVDNGRMVLLHDKPVVTSVVESIDDAVMSILLLPRDIAQGQGEDPDVLSALQPSPAGKLFMKKCTVLRQNSEWKV